jgi:predicted DNA-binding protein YlxM (UPF0122 family)
LSDNPFWFLNENLLVALLTDEFRLITELFVKYPKLPEFFDLPDATAEQKVACFALLVHRTLIAEIDEKFLGLHQQPPSLGEEGRAMTALMQNLFADDAPLWVSEINSVAERLPSRIYNALPEPLRRGGFFNASDPTQMEIIRSAANKLSNLEEIQKLNKEVFDQQLQRLEKRWSAATPIFQQGLVTEAKHLKGTEGLVTRNNLSQYAQYMDHLTEKQHLAFRLKFEYELGLTDIASRMGIDRKTADEHIKAARKKVEQARSNEKSKARREKHTPEF